MKNPIVPFLLIFALGIGLIFFMSLYGLDQKEEIAGEADGEATDEVVAADFDAAEVAQGKCISCHGGDFEGGMGGAAPALTGTSLSQDELVDILANGQGSMPAGLVPGNEAEMAEYLLTLE